MWQSSFINVSGIQNQERVYKTDAPGLNNNFGIFSPDGRWIASPTRQAADIASLPEGISLVSIWEAETGQEVQRMAVAGDIVALAFNADGQRVAAGTASGLVQVGQIGSRRPLADLYHDDVITALAFSPDGQLAASGSQDGVVKIWKAATGEVVAQLTHPEVKELTFSPDGQQVYSMSWDGLLIASNPLTGAAISQYHLPIEFSDAIVFSPDGRWLAIDGGSAVQIWNLATGQEVARKTNASGYMAIVSLAFSPDGRWVAYSDWSEQVRVWLWQPDDLINQACSRLSRNLSQAEWETYFPPGMPYHQTCPNLPPGDGAEEN